MSNSKLIPRKKGRANLALPIDAPKSPPRTLFPAPVVTSSTLVWNTDRPRPAPSINNLVSNTMEKLETLTKTSIENEPWIALPNFGENRELWYPSPEGQLSAFTGRVEILEADRPLLLNNIKAEWGFLNSRLALKKSDTYAYRGQVFLESLPTSTQERVEAIMRITNDTHKWAMLPMVTLLGILDVPAYMYRDKTDISMLDKVWNMRETPTAFYTPFAAKTVIQWFKDKVRARTPDIKNWQLRIGYNLVTGGGIDQEGDTFFYEDDRRYGVYNSDSIMAAIERIYDTSTRNEGQTRSDPGEIFTSLTHNVVFYFERRKPSAAKRGGAFFPYVLDLSFPGAERYKNYCDRLQIYNSASTFEMPKYCCLEYAMNTALQQQGLPSIAIDRNYIHNNRVNSADLPEICKQLDLCVMLRRCSHAEDISTKIKGVDMKANYGAKTVLDLFLIMNHYMVYEKGIRIPGDKKVYTTRTLLKYLLESHMLRPMNTAELIKCSPKDIDAGTVFSITENPEYIAQGCTKPADENEGVTTQSLINAYNYSATLSDKKATKKAEKLMNSRFPFQGKKFYVIFFDTETFTHQSVVSPYLLSWKTYICDRVDGTLRYEYTYEEHKHVFHRSCASYLFDYLMNLSPLEDDPQVNVKLIAHNLGFDMSSFWSVFGSYESCLGTRARPKQIKYKRYRNKITYNMVFQDSYNLIRDKLANFPAKFKLEGDFTMAKMKFPYAYFNAEVAEKLFNHGQEYVPLSEFVEEWKKLGEIEENIYKSLNLTKAIVGEESVDVPDHILCSYYCEGKQWVNLKALALGYCNSDVDILADGYQAYMTELREAMDIVPEKYFTTASWAYAYLLQHGGLLNCSKLKGELRLYITNSIYGGRCMTREGKAWWLVRCPGGGWAYYDGVSLYPSAMIRMGGVPYGAPNHITSDPTECWNLTFKCPYYVATLDILSHPRELPFPLLVTRTENGNEYRNDFKGPIVLTKYDIDILTLYGYEEGKHYTYKHGVFWDKLSMGIGEVIGKVFDKRAHIKNNKCDPSGREYTKAEKDSEAILKEVMNSCYGKTIQRFFPVMVDYFINYVDFDKEDEPDPDFLTTFDKIIMEYGDNIKSVSQVYTGFVTRINPQGKLYESKEQHYEVRTSACGDGAENRCHVGSAILGMARLIMAEVFWCIEKLEKMDSTEAKQRKYVFYTDTDSMLVDVTILDRLKELYKQEFGRELDGTGAGQFHSDFEPLKDAGVRATIGDGVFDKNYIPRSVESYIIGKKFYCHNVEYKYKTKEGEEKYGTYLHSRLKGVPDSIRKQFTMDDYRMFYAFQKCDLFGDKKVDLLEGGNRVRFKFDASTNQMKQFEDFNRTIGRIITETEKYEQ